MRIQKDFQKGLILSGTVIPVRESGGQTEVLLLHRNPALAVFGGYWVFPGGRVDPADHGNGTPESGMVTARNAASREAREEAGLFLPPETMIPVSRWVTPEGMARRFSTWFFAARAEVRDVFIDGEEILDFQWMAPGDAVKDQEQGRKRLPPPIYVSLLRLAEYPSHGALFSDLKRRPPPVFRPKVIRVDGGSCFLYEEDASYQTGDLSETGPRHRLWTLKTGWRYESPD